MSHFRVQNSFPNRAFFLFVSLHTLSRPTQKVDRWVLHENGHTSHVKYVYVTVAHVERHKKKNSHSNCKLISNLCLQLGFFACVSLLFLLFMFKITISISVIFMVCLIFLFLANFFFMIIRISKQFPFHKSKVNTINMGGYMTCSFGVIAR
jgi:succinate-acetate transporter protein